MTEPKGKEKKKKDRQQVLKEISESTSVKIDVTPAYFPQTPIRDLGFGVKTENFYQSVLQRAHLILTWCSRCTEDAEQMLSGASAASVLQI